MRRLVLPFLLLLGLGFTGERASAEMLGDAQVPFSAERTVTVNGRSYTGMLFHVPGRERHEQDIQGLHEVILLDAQKAHGWLVLADLKTYVEFAFPPLMAELGAPDLRRYPMGQETVNGVRTTKYRVDHTAADGSRAEGFVWVSASGVLMRIDCKVARAGAARGAPIRMELSNLRQGPQDPSLFDLPPNLVKLPSSMLDQFLGGKSG